MAVRKSRAAPVILTPQAGEFAALFGEGEGSKIDRARPAACEAGVVMVFKGADTVIAAPDGAAGIACDATDCPSTAGPGDVPAGVIAAILAGGMAPFEAHAAGVWPHAGASRSIAADFLADDLP